jgi:hypothetical protein
MKPDAYDDSNLESLFKEAATAFAPPEGLKQAMRARLLSISQTTSAAPQVRNRHRFRLIKLATLPLAACLTLALLVWWFLLTSGPTQSAYAQLTQAIQNSDAAEWVKMTPWDKTTGEKGRAETWISFRPFRNASKTDDRVNYKNDSTKCEYSYDAKTRTITIQPFDVSEVSMLQVRSFADLLNRLAADWSKRKETAVSKGQDTIDGKTYTTFTFDNKIDNVRSRFFVDPANQRVAAMEAQSSGHSAPVKARFEYPTTGPADIYALGVPRDAKIIRIPSDDVRELDAKVKAARNAFAPTYQAIICKAEVEADGRYRPDYIHVVSQKAGKYRIAMYGYRIDSSPAMARTAPITDHSALEAWLRQVPPDRILFVGHGQQLAVERDFKTGQIKTQADRIWAEQYTVEYLSWGMSRRGGVGTTIISPEDPADRHLMVRQIIHDGGILRGRNDDRGRPVYPEREREYYDPQRHFILQRWEQLEDAQGDWQLKRDWLKPFETDPAITQYRRLDTRTIVEAAQTPQGQWYAAKVLSRSGSDQPRVDIVYLDTTRDIPDSLLDPAAVGESDIRPIPPSMLSPTGVDKSDLPPVAPPPPTPVDSPR